jgi:hypothetical protein
MREVCLGHTKSLWGSSSLNVLSREQRGTIYAFAKIKYASSGKKALVIHASQSRKHVENFAAKLTNQQIINTASK